METTPVKADAWTSGFLKVVACCQEQHSVWEPGLLWLLHLITSCRVSGERDLCWSLDQVSHPPWLPGCSVCCNLASGSGQEAADCTGSLPAQRPSVLALEPSRAVLCRCHSPCGCPLDEGHFLFPALWTAVDPRAGLET